MTYDRLEELADDERERAAEPASRRRREGDAVGAIPSKDAGPHMRATSVDEPTPAARASATNQQQMRGVPMNAAMNLGFTMTTLMLFIVAYWNQPVGYGRVDGGRATQIFAMAFAGPCALSASMTQKEKMK